MCKLLITVIYTKFPRSYVVGTAILTRAMGMLNLTPDRKDARQAEYSSYLTSSLLPNYPSDITLKKLADISMISSYMWVAQL